MLRTRYRTLLVGVVTLCITALALGDLLRGIHLLSEAHVVCIEHGELIDVNGAAPAVSGSSTAENSRSAFTRSGSSIEHHVHCAIAAAPARLGRALPPSFVVAVGAAPHAASIDPAGDAPVLSRSILADAPKQSPPV